MGPEEGRLQQSWGAVLKASVLSGDTLSLRLVRACGLLRTHCKIAGFKGLLYYLLMCLRVWVCSQKPKEGAGSLGAEVTVSCELLDLRAGNLQALLAAEPLLQLQHTMFYQEVLPRTVPASQSVPRATESWPSLVPP